MSNKKVEEKNVKEFYAQDVVYRFDERNKIMFGVVLESYESFDSDEYSGLKKGQMVVLWNKRSRKQLCKQSKVHLISRSIIPGDIVRRLEEGKETQRGYCKWTEQWATVRIIDTDKVIEHVPDSRLYFVKPFEVGDAVCLGEKFGRIQNVEQIIKMQSKCGSIVEINSSINFGIRDYWNSSINLGPVYPGQMVMCTPTLLNNPKWLRKTKTMNRRMSVDQTFTIQSITPYLIEVWWYNSNCSTEYAELREDEIKRLKVLPFTDFSCLGGRQVIQLQPNDVLLKNKDWIRKMSLLYQPDKVPKNNENTKNIKETNKRTSHLIHINCNGDDFKDEEEEWFSMEDEEVDSEDNKLLRRITKVKLAKLWPKKTQYKQKISPGSLLAVEVICVTSKATIVWQDGTLEKGIPTKELYYSVSLDDHEFFPGEWVVPIDDENSVKYGVVQRVNFVERTAEIKWFLYSNEQQRPEEIHTTSQMSVYELKKHPKYIFRPGSVVRKKPVQADVMGKVVDSCPQGYVKVQWINGTIQHCWPQDIELLPESEIFDYPDDGSTESDSDDSNEDGYSWETESSESYDGDVTDDIILHNMAAKVNFIRDRISNLREAFKHYNINKNLNIVKDLLYIYENSSYLDKYLGTSFFSLESKHFQVLLSETKKKAKSLGIEVRGRLFSNDSPSTVNKPKNLEMENIQKVIKLESKVNAQIENSKECSGYDSTLATPDSVKSEKSEEDLCVELLLMLKMRMDLVYAEIVSRMGGREALSVLKNTTERPPSNSKLLLPLDSTIKSVARTSEEILKLKLPPSKQSQIDGEKVTSTTETNESFSIIEDDPDTHHYFLINSQSKDLQKFSSTLHKEFRLLKESLPSGVWVKSYADRIDLLSVMILGPAKTPYEDGLFLFDIQLRSDYPRSPPSVHYISFISEVLNPNLYVEGKVCVSLLGTWIGRGSEVWGPNSTLLQLIVSIQGLILVAEPYYNEAGYEKQVHTQQGYENSRTYNEYVLLKLVQSMTALLNNCPLVFRKEILNHFKANGEKMCERLLSYCLEENPVRPEFPLQPVSKGLQLSLTRAIERFREVLKKALELRANC